MDINTLATDTDATENGIWFYLDSEESSGFLIARLGNAKYRVAAAKHIGPHAQAMTRGALKIDTQDRLLAKVLAETVILNWKGITQGVDTKGEPKPFKYTKEACEAFLVEPKYQDLVKQLIEFANESANYRLSEIRESENDSAPESAGS